MSGQTYTPEEQRAAWAEYYRQQGYDEASIAAALGPAGSGSSTASTSQGGVGVGAPSQWSTYDSTAASTSYKPQAVPTSGPSTAHVNAAMPADVAKLYSADYMGANIYAPGQGEDGAGAPKHKPKPPPGKRDTVIRKGNGRTWEDPTLLEWDPKWYRLFVGDVSNDVNEKTLDEAFGKYPSYAKCKVVRDRLSLKAKYGFIAFKDPEDFLRAWKENDGKYIGNRPIRLSKVKDEQYGGVETVTVSGRKAKMLDKVRQNRGKPLDGRPVPW